MRENSLGKKKTLISFWLTIVILLLSSHSDAETIICRKSEIAGFDHCYEKALKVLGKTNTSDMKKTIIFIFWDKELSIWYIHSNFVTPPKNKGYYPTKIVTDETNSIELITQNIIFDGHSQPAESVVGEFWDAYENYMQFIVDAPDSNFSRLKFGNAQNIRRVSRSFVSPDAPDSNFSRLKSGNAQNIRRSFVSRGFLLFISAITVFFLWYWWSYCRVENPQKRSPLLKVCSNCGSKNRIPLDKIGLVAKCGRCGAPLRVVANP